MNTAPVVAIQRNPFPGLRPFREDEEYLFFGRENQVNAMVDKLAATRFLAVVGTSGSGKSSLVNCGLRPALHGGLMARAGTAWRMAQFRPGSDPLGAMARELAQDDVLFRDYQAGGLTLAEIVDTTLRMSKLGLIDIYEQAQVNKDVNLLVEVDQFEELFRYRQLGAVQHKDVSGISEAATAFVNLLLEVKEQTTYPIYVVLTMRSDFLGDCAQFPGLAEAINAGQYLVPRMTRDERRAAISGPVGVGGAEIAPVLLTRLVNDVGDNPDQLSILQHALNRTWARRQHEGGGKGPLDLAHYEAIGTMDHALDQHAEKAYAELGSARQQQICEKLFKALTDKATDPRGVRRPTTLGTLGAMADATAAEVTEVIDVFRKPSRSFLMPPAGEALEAETVIDISHESLMRVWTRLKTWTDEEVESVAEYLRLADSARRWKSGQAELLQGRELERAEAWKQYQGPTAAWAERYHPGFTETIGYVEQSRQGHDERIRRARAVRRNIRAGVAVACAILACVTVWAVGKKWEADGLRKEGQRLLANSYLRGIGQASDNLHPQEIETLWELASTTEENRQVRELFLKNALKSEANARQLQNRIDLVAHALVGLNNENRKALLPIALRSLKEAQGGFDAKLAAAQLFPYLVPHGDADVESVATVARAIEMAIQQEKNSERRFKLGKALGSLEKRLPQKVANDVAKALMDAMQNEKDSLSLSWLGKALGGLGKRLPKKSAAAGADALVAKIQHEKDPYKIYSLGEALGSLGKRLSETASATVANALVATMRQTTDSVRLALLGAALGGLGKRLPDKSAAVGTAALLAKIKQEKDSNRLSNLANALGSIGERLSETASATVANTLVEAMRQTTDSVRLASLGAALGGLGKRLPENLAYAGAQTLLAAMKEEQNGERLFYLGATLASVGERLSEASAAAVAKVLLERMKKEQDRPIRSYFGMAIMGVGKRLDEKSATDVAMMLVAAVRDERQGEEHSDAYVLSRLGLGLGGVSNQLTADAVDEVAKTLVEAMQQNRDSNELYYLRRALGGLGAHLRGARAKAAVDAILIMNATDSLMDDTLKDLLKVLTSVTKRLNAQQVVDVLKDPHCVGKARVAVLKVLEEKTDGLFHDKHDLHLMPVKDETSIPIKGTRLVIVAKVNDQLHFRIFDAEGEMVVDESEAEHLSPADTELVSLKSQLQNFWEVSEMEIPEIEKTKIIESVTSLFGHTTGHDIWKLVEQADKFKLDVSKPPTSPAQPKTAKEDN
jgi:energy-coupling factor transporter ATP-binding protein EcfA2